jgi:hypothetical protein
MKVFVLLVLLFSIEAFAQEKRYSCSFFGTNLYTKPSVSSKLIDSIPFGDSVEFINQGKKMDVIPSKSGFILKGSWTQVKYKDRKGYVFGADLSSKRTEASLFDEKNPGYLGKLLEYRMLDMGSLENFTLGYRVETFNDGCVDEKVILRTYSLNEVYHMMMQSYSDLTGSEFPIFSGQVETTLNFSGVGATISISIEQLPQGIFQITSYACD